MFKNKNADGTLNIPGNQVTVLRKERNMSQRALADELQLLGLDVSKNAIQQIESGKRFVIDVELKIIAEFFDVPDDKLLSKD